MKNFHRLIAATFIAVGAIAGTGGAIAQQADWPTFELDLAASSIDVQSRGCAVSCTSVAGSFGQGAHDFSWTPTSANDSLYVDDFFNWTTEANGFGAGTYSVQTELVFSSPDVQSASAGGRGFVVQLWGDVSAGVLRWTNVASVTFAQGSTLDIAFQGLAGAWHGTASTGARFIGNLIAPNSGGGGGTSSVPLPGSLILLITAFGIFAIGTRLTHSSRGGAPVTA